MIESMEKLKLRAMKSRFDEWPEGYFCYICAEPIEKGKLCSKHKNWFNEEFLRIEEMEKKKREEAIHSSVMEELRRGYGG